MKTEQQIRQEIAGRLKEYCDQHDLTQREMAKLLDVTLSAYKKYVQCKNTMPLHIAYKLALLTKQKHLANQ
jgi:predicted XRE-type DNA-binding protein